MMKKKKKSSTFNDFLNESGKAFGEIKDYGIDKGTDEVAKWAIGEGFGKLISGAKKCIYMIDITGSKL